MSLIFELYSIYKRIYHYTLVFILWFLNRNKKQIVPSANNEILYQSAVFLAKEIKSRKLTSVRVVEAFIERINEVNPIVNALVDQRFNEALIEAKEVDEKLQNGMFSSEELDQLVLLGVPFTVKESTNCKGLSATFGLICRKGLKAEEDADIVLLMKKAGAILLGVCNIPEVNFWFETYNPVFGRTNNPYDTTRNVGGSTGGDACLIASLGIPMALGTDLAGSVRSPAYCCGIFGHKPTNDLISTKGMTYRNGTEGPTMAIAGPMAKKSEDLLPMLKVLTKNNPKLNLDTGEIDITKVRISYTTSIECFSNGPIGKDSRDSVKKCADYFQGFSEAKPKNVHIEALDHGVKLWIYSAAKEKGSHRRAIKNLKKEASLSEELFKLLCGNCEHSLYTLLMMYKMSNPPGITEENEQLVEAAREELTKTIGDDGVLIMPSEVYPAGYHYTTALEFSIFGFYCIFNVLKFPVTQVPLGLNSEGLPVGVQIVGTPFNDKLTIAVANELEKAFGGYAQPIP